MLRCRELVELVTDWLEADLGPDLELEVRHHLEECVGCRVFLGQTVTTRSLLRRLGPT